MNKKMAIVALIVMIASAIVSYKLVGQLRPKPRAQTTDTVDYAFTQRAERIRAEFAQMEQQLQRLRQLQAATYNPSEVMATIVGERPAPRHPGQYVLRQPVQHSTIATSASERQVGQALVDLQGAIVKNTPSTNTTTTKNKKKATVRKREPATEFVEVQLADLKDDEPTQDAFTLAVYGALDAAKHYGEKRHVDTGCHGIVFYPEGNSRQYYARSGQCASVGTQAYETYEEHKQRLLPPRPASVARR